LTYHFTLVLKGFCCVLATKAKLLGKHTMFASTHKDKHMTDGKAETGSKIADDLRKGADHVKSDIHDTVNAVNGDLHKMAHQAGGHLREFAGSAEQSVEDTAGSVAKQIRANPIQSTLIALGAGVVLGALFRR
jgi:ElaB/YqjD/DUF883 family membrane-anchored ribosome-binding protein